MSCRPFYDVDDVDFRAPYRFTRGGWGRVAPQIITDFKPPPQAARPLCAEVDPELFFAEGDRWASRRAKRICQSCPIKTECRETAIARCEEFGVWGGTVHKERQRIRVARRLAAETTDVK